MDKLVLDKVFKMDFPIVKFLSQIQQIFAQQSNLIIEAEPGAGKTSLVPLALLPLLNKSKKILLLEPRRIAAKNAALRLSQLVEQPVGQYVGYVMRDAVKVSSTTKIEVITEGVLLSRLQQDPELHDIGAIIFDEFHERSLNADLGLAFCLDVQQSIRNDLKLVVMSATLDSDRLFNMLPQVKTIKVPGRSFAVKVSHIEPKNKSVTHAKEGWKTTLTKAIDLALTTAHKDILIFLAGVPEINLAEKIIQENHSLSAAVSITKLHANLTFAQQQQAITFNPTQRKVILSTNVAESSLTIPGVDAVIDTGLVKLSRFDPNSGFDQLVTMPVSQASATQRAGRAGRLTEGYCWRLWSKNNKLKPHLAPEIMRCDLASLVLKIKDWGAPDCQSLALLDQPNAGSINQAESLLQLLGLISSKQQLTESGKAVINLNIEPRLGAMLMCGLQLGCVQLACIVAAILEEKDFFRLDSHASADFSLRINWLLSSTKTKQSERVLSQAKRYTESIRHLNLPSTLKNLKPLKAWCALDQVELNYLPCLLAAAFPDRVAVRRNQSYKLANGKGASLHELESQPDYLIAVRVSGNQQRSLSNSSNAKIYLYQETDLPTLRELFDSRSSKQLDINFDDAKERVIAVEKLMFGHLELAQFKPCKVAPELIIEALESAILRKGVENLPWNQNSQLLIQRVTLLRQFADFQAELPSLSFDWLSDNLKQWLMPLLNIDADSIEFKLSTINAELLETALQGILGWEKLQLIDTMLPKSLPLPSGYCGKIDYSNPTGPILAVKLQLLFGVTHTPRIANGLIPLSLHLLSPAGRPLQVTQDLASFWHGSYNEVKKEMRGRYPKHPWPDDPIQAVATHKTKSQI
jgi:ATP-dependent helicase HrpB